MTSSNSLLFSPVTYRALGAEDAEQVLDLIRKNSDRFSTGGLALLPLSESSYSNFISNSDDVVVGAFQNNVCIGFAGVTRMRVGAMPKPGAGVWYGVDSEAGGRGVATAVAIEALKYFKAKFPDTDEAIIHCQPRNKKSIKLAARLGFVRNPQSDYKRHQSSRSSTKLEGYATTVSTVLAKDFELEFAASAKKKKIEKIIKAAEKSEPKRISP